MILISKIINSFKNANEIEYDKIMENGRSLNCQNRIFNFKMLS